MSQNAERDSGKPSRRGGTGPNASEKPRPWAFVVGLVLGILALFAADAMLREEFARKGLARAAAFTWPKAVEKTWSVYRELL